MNMKDYWKPKSGWNREFGSRERDEKIAKYKEENPFSLFKDVGHGVTSTDVKKAEEAEKEFKKLWNKFVKDWLKLQNKYIKQGAVDTMSREYQLAWIRKHAEEIF